MGMRPSRRVTKSEESVQLRIETDYETDGRWIADVVELPGVMSYGPTKHDAIHAAEQLAQRVIAERVENGELDRCVLEFEYI